MPVSEDLLHASSSSSLISLYFEPFAFYKFRFAHISKVSSAEFNKIKEKDRSRGAQQMQQQVYQVAFAGVEDSGKTTALKSYCSSNADSSFETVAQKVQPTIGASFFAMSFSNLVKIELWDTAGMEKFVHILHCFFIIDNV